MNLKIFQLFDVLYKNDINFFHKNKSKLLLFYIIFLIFINIYIIIFQAKN